MEAEQNAILSCRIKRKHMVQSAATSWIREGCIDMHPDVVDESICHIDIRGRYFPPFCSSLVEKARFPQAKTCSLQLNEALGPVMKVACTVIGLAVDTKRVAHK